MCLVAPARVLAFDGADAVVAVDGRIRRASMLRSPEIGINDWVLVAAGTVVRRLDADEAIELERVIRAAIALTNAEPAGAGPGGSR